MPIKKIVSLKNIGRFKSLAAKGDVQFRRLTLVYGSNGHGKTTLAGVLRSLATGDRAYVDERATLGVAEPPEAEILLEAGPLPARCLFRSGSSKMMPVSAGGRISLTSPSPRSSPNALSRSGNTSAALCASASNVRLRTPRPPSWRTRS